MIISSPAARWTWRDSPLTSYGSWGGDESFREFRLLEDQLDAGRAGLDQRVVGRARIAVPARHGIAVLV